MESEKLHVKLTDPIAETLFIPLLVRSKETEHPKKIIDDPTSCELVSKIDYNSSKFGKIKSSMVGVAIRSRHFDNAVKRFINRHDKPVVVNIGCGLDSRYQRIKDKKTVFYELDIPEVMQLRAQLLPPAPNDNYIYASMLDTEWMDLLKSKHLDSPFIFIAEGVFMYFTESDVKKVITNLAQRFSNSELHFDSANTWVVKNLRPNHVAKSSKARFKWGFDNDKAIERWSDAITHIDTVYLLRQEKRRWGIKGYISRQIPKIEKSFRLLHYTIG